MRVSTMTSVFNGEKYLQTCIDSLLNQTYDDIEYIFVDNASTDGTWRILSQLKNNPKVKLIRRNHNIGIAAAYRDALNVSTGDIVCILDSDDIAHPNRVATTVNTFIAHPEASLVYSSMNYIGPDGKQLGYVRGLPDYLTNTNLFYHLFRRVFFFAPAVSFRNGDWFNFDLDINSADYDLSVQLAEQGKNFIFIPKPLMSYRIHPRNTSANGNKNIQEMRLVQSRYSPDFLTKRWVEDGFTDYQIAANFGINTYYFEKDYAKAETYFYRALKSNSDIISAHFYLGCIQYQKGQLGGAEKHFAEAYRLNPNSFECAHNYGIVTYLSKGDRKTADECLSKAQRLQPKFLLTARNAEAIHAGKVGELKIAHTLYDEDSIFHTYFESVVRG